MPAVMAATGLPRTCAAHVRSQTKRAGEVVRLALFPKDFFFQFSVLLFLFAGTWLLIG